jgi:hypothetical protein
MPCDFALSLLVDYREGERERRREEGRLKKKGRETERKGERLKREGKKERARACPGSGEKA